MYLLSLSLNNVYLNYVGIVTCGIISALCSLQTVPVTVSLVLRLIRANAIRVKLAID